MVFAHRAYKEAVANSHLRNTPLGGGGLIPDWKTDGTSSPKEMILITQSVKELKLLMSDYVGIVRNNERLHRAMRRLDLLLKKPKSCIKKPLCRRSCANCGT